MANPLVSLFGGWLRSPLITLAGSASNQWAGRLTIPGNSASNVVSTSIVQSDSIILLGCVGNANVTSGVGLKPFEVKTISPGAYFIIGTQDGQTIVASRPTVVGWMIVKTS